jgi:hypothetical protein
LPAIDAMLKGNGKLDAGRPRVSKGARRQIRTARGGHSVRLPRAAPADAVAALAKAARGRADLPRQPFEHGQWPRVTMDVERLLTP